MKAGRQMVAQLPHVAQHLHGKQGLVTNMLANAGYVLDMPCCSFERQMLCLYNL